MHRKAGAHRNVWPRPAEPSGPPGGLIIYANREFKQEAKITALSQGTSVSASRESGLAYKSQSNPLEGAQAERHPMVVTELISLGTSWTSKRLQESGTKNKSGT